MTFYRIVWRPGPHDAWQVVTKRKSKRPRLYDKLGFANNAMSLIRSDKPKVEYRVEQVETTEDWKPT